MPFDFDAAVRSPFRMQPGLRRLAAGDTHLTPSSQVDSAGQVMSTADHLREKLQMLADAPQRGLLVQAGFDPAPALRQLVTRAEFEHPQVFRCVDDQHFRFDGLGWLLVHDQLVSVDQVYGEDEGNGALFQQRRAPTAIDPVLHAGIGQVVAGLAPCWRLPAMLSLAFEQDLAIIDGRSATVPWLAVCLPSFWSPAEKLGRQFAQIHGPVADADLLRGAGDHLMKLVSGNEHWERFVWTLTAAPNLNAHPQQQPRPAWPASLTLDEFAAGIWWRTERQTFLPVPGQDQAIFTIQVATRPFTQAIDTAARAAALHASLASMTRAVIDYRGFTAARDRLLAWLAERASRA